MVFGVDEEDNAADFWEVVAPEATGCKCVSGDYVSDCGTLALLMTS